MLKNMLNDFFALFFDEFYKRTFLIILGYNSYREICQVGKARRWEDFEDYISTENVGKLREIYGHIDCIYYVDHKNRCLHAR